MKLVWRCSFSNGLHHVTFMIVAISPVDIAQSKLYTDLRKVSTNIGQDLLPVQRSGILPNVEISMSIEFQFGSKYQSNHLTC